MTCEAALCKLYGITHMLIVIIFILPNQTANCTHFMVQIMDTQRHIYTHIFKNKNEIHSLYKIGG